ncbi:lethal (2) giant discs 1 isoform X2 [Arctopsyche grandis]|uniref:lethal (2) giant discs 1 isoform X2 n=1 Tax=Arctopsyche grandis TaxID=121162 RepID=UPI00406D729C
MARRPRPPLRQRGAGLSQYGLFDMPDNIDDFGNDDGGDSDLEAELAAIAGGGKPKQKSKPKPKLIPTADLDNLIADSMRDIPTDEEVSDGEDDPDLLNELSELTIGDEEAPEPVSEPMKASRPAPPAPQTANSVDLVSLLQERVEMYTIAEQNAKDIGDSSRARRFNRGLKTLKDQLKQAKAGKPVNEEDIPPIVSTSKHNPAENPVPASVNISPEPEPVPVLEPEPAPLNLSDETMSILNVLTDRRNEYKAAALLAKKSGDNVTAMNHVKMVKQFERVIEAVKSGQPFDLSNMPGPPDSNNVHLPQREEEHTQQSADDPPAESYNMESEDVPVSLIAANSAAEALQQRLELYKQQEAAANEAGNSSKARRMGRIVKQYQQAIKLNSAGKPIPFDELPTPPGYAPIPGAPQPVPESAPPPEPTSAPAAPPKPQPAQSPSNNNEDRPGKLANTGRSNSVRKMGNQIGTGHADRQLTVLLQRQKEFKEAALNSKKNGEIQEAKEYLRCAKGLDPLIEASKCGLPVDFSTVPLPPQAKQELEDSFDVINTDDCDPNDDGLGDIISRLEEQLTTQLKLCLTTRDHHKALGDVAGTNRFEHLALNVKQDLDIVKMCKRTGSSPPKFHYETKQFSIVQCCTDLGDNDLELTIVRGISYTVANPKDIDTYVKFEFPYPQEEPIRDKTVLVKDTNSPEYNAAYTLAINRTARPCLRIFKRHAIKLEVYSRGGLFTRDSVIGTVMVKLQPLETQTVLHESYDLMDGRRTVGGKLEVKVRVRHPMLAKQVEQTTQKWLVIDH